MKIHTVHRSYKCICGKIRLDGSSVYYFKGNPCCSLACVEKRRQATEPKISSKQMNLRGFRCRCGKLVQCRQGVYFFKGTSFCSRECAVKYNSVTVDF